MSLPLHSVFATETMSVNNQTVFIAAELSGREILDEVSLLLKAREIDNTFWLNYDSSKYCRT